MTLFLDIETQNSWAAGDAFIIEEMKISYSGVIDDTGTEYDFWEKDTPAMAALIKSADLTVHYNGFSFDMPVIANYVSNDILDVPQIDLMVAAHKAIGFRPKLDDLATATLGEGKIGKGSDAPKYWAAGDLESLKKYCLQDVKVTKDLYDFGLEHGYIKYFDKNGFLRQADIDWELGRNEVKAVEDPQMQSMF